MPPSARIRHPYIAIETAEVKYQLAEQGCEAGVTARIWTIHQEERWVPSEAFGPIGLVGGDEFKAPATAFDRLLLSLAPRTPASVAILPTAAASDENPHIAAAHGVKHFEQVGAKPFPVNIHDAATANDDAVVDELRRADIVYFSGGNPSHLLASLKDSAAWTCLLDLVQQGVIIAGSSAGAMVFGERMHYRGQDVAGLGLVPGVVVMPHFERVLEERLAQLQASLSPGLTLLGIAGATGCVLHDGEWLVEGPGHVTAISESGIEIFVAGARFGLP